MKRSIFLFFIFLCYGAAAQQFNSGTLPNGVKYYLVTNTTIKGYADFSLVQKGNTDRAGAAASLTKLPHWGSVKPYEYLSSKGIGYDRSGYVHYNKAAARFDFRDVPVFDEAVTDSTLLAVFDIMQGYNGEQAVIISGDINADKTVERMQMLSLLVPERTPLKDFDPYSWQSSDEILYECGPFPDTTLAKIEVNYFMQRSSNEALQGNAPLVMKMFAGEMEVILRDRLSKGFRKEGIPLSEMSFSYSDSFEGMDDENIILGVYTDKKDLYRACTCISRVLSGLEFDGVSRSEVVISRDIRARKYARKLLKKNYGGNSVFVGRCAQAYLFGRATGNPADDDLFMSRKVLETEQEQALLQNFISGILSDKDNLVLRFDSPDFLDQQAQDSLVRCFRKGWRDKMTFKSKVRMDTSKVASVPTGKLKIKSSTVDPLTGGSLWTFSNGMRVLYKKIDNAADIRYSLVLKEGSGSVPGIAPGESAFIADMLRLSNIGNMSPDYFQTMLAANGITMDIDVSLCDMRIGGTVPGNRFSLLLKSLISMANVRSRNNDFFRNFREQQMMSASTQRFSPGAVNDILDSLSFPGYAYSSRKEPLKGLSEDLQERAEWLFGKAFSNCSNGILILEAGMGEKEMQEILCKYLNGFRAGNPTSARPKASKEVKSGNAKLERNTSYYKYGRPLAAMRFTTEVPFNVKRDAALEVLRLALKQDVVKAMAPLGYSVRVEVGYELYPKELMSISVYCDRCNPTGLPEGVEIADAALLPDAIRAALKGLCVKNLDNAPLTGYKNAVISRKEFENTGAEVIMDAAIKRYSIGKDTMTGWKDAAQALTAQDIRDLASKLYSGVQAEFVLR